MFTRLMKIAIGLLLVAYPFFTKADSYLESALFIVMGILCIVFGIEKQELPAGVSRVQTSKSKRDELLLSKGIIKKQELKDIMEQDFFSTDMDDSSIAPQRSRDLFPRHTASKVMALCYKAAMGDGQPEIVLPFIMGVMGDFSGAAATKPGINERVFLTIRENNFSAVLNQLKPRVKFEIEDLITGDHTMDVDLTFARLSDFFPEAVAAQLASKLPPVDGTQHDMDKRLASQRDAIIHHESFLRLESTWCGLWFLVSSVRPGNEVEVRILDISRDEAAGLFNSDSDPTEAGNPLWRLLNSQVFGQPSAHPYGAIICDWEFAHSAADMPFLRGLGRLGSKIQAPFLAAASPLLFGCSSWSDLSRTGLPEKLQEGEQYSDWHRFRAMEVSSWVALCLPRFLGQPALTLPHMGSAVRYQCGEGSRPPGNLWINAAYALGSRILRAFQVYGWPARFRGVERGGMIEGLPITYIEDHQKGGSRLAPVEFSIGDREEARLARAGFVSLTASPDPRYAGRLSIIGAQTTQAMPEHNLGTAIEDPDWKLNEEMLRRLSSLLSLARIVQHLRCLARDRADDLGKAGHLQNELTDWLSHYVKPGENRAEPLAPLDGAGVSIVPHPDKPGFGLMHIELSGMYNVGVGPVRGEFNTEILIVPPAPS